MKIDHAFAHVSGLDQDYCHWIAHRFDKKYGFSPENGDSWVCQSDGEDSHTLLSQPGWMTGIWRSERRVWVSQISGHIYMNPSLEVRKEEWKTFDIDASLSGIWGLSDKLVFTWGLRGQKPVMFLYEGKRWKKIEVPGHIGAVRGIREDLIYAVGLNGLIARFDGRGFEVVDNPSDGNLSDVFVASEEEMYACGLDGHLLRGSVKGWERLLQYDGALHCVAKWGDTVWVGAGPDGLYALVNGKLKLRKDTVKAEEFDARGNLLAACPLAIAETTNGKDWVGTVIDVFQELSEHEKPHWR